MTKESDEDLALEYLGCKVTEDVHGQLSYSYVKPDSPRERVCLEAMVRLLRGGAQLRFYERMVMRATNQGGGNCSGGAVRSSLAA